MFVALRRFALEREGASLSQALPCNALRPRIAPLIRPDFARPNWLLIG